MLCFKMCMPVCVYVCMCLPACLCACLLVHIYTICMEVLLGRRRSCVLWNWTIGDLGPPDEDTEN